MLYYLFRFLEEEFNMPGASVFEYISFRTAMAVLFSLLITMVFGKRIIYALQKKQIGETIRDLGLEGQMQKKGTPTMGGLMMIAGIIIPTLLFAKLQNVYIILMLVSTLWLGTIGFIDDYIKVFRKNKEGLRGKFKIMGQIGLGLLVGITLYFNNDVVIQEKVPVGEEVRLESFENVVNTERIDREDESFYLVSYKSMKTTTPFFKDNEFDYSSLLTWMGDNYWSWVWLIFIPIVIFIITAVSNGANMTDGLDGLAAGTSAIIIFTLTVLIYVSGNFFFAEYLNVMYIPKMSELTIFTGAMIGACIGFLWYNTYPAQVFMGDTGSLTLGGLIAVLAIIARKELIIPVLCGVFLVENLSVVLQVAYFKYTKKKFGEGRRIFKMAPLHHHYQKKDYPEPKIVSRFWIIGIFLAIISILTLKLRQIMFESDHHQVVILGGGESGIGAAQLAQQHGMSPYVSDKGRIRPSHKEELNTLQIPFEEGQHTEDIVLGAKFIIKSPGIPNKVPIVQKAFEKGISVISEIEFAAQFTNAKLIGITGTNGKTTTASLTHHILKNAGFKTKIAGNIGNSFAREVAADNDETEYYVLEISSFQLDNIQKLKFHLSVLLNITPDHLDRYESLEAYIRAKLKITNRQTPSEKFIFNFDDDNIKAHLDEITSTPDHIPFSQQTTLKKGAYMNNNHMELNMESDIVKFSVEDMLIKGKHNRYNSMAAAVVAKALNVRKDVIRESLASYKNIEHRLEHVARIRGVDYINDSKATNVNAVWYALESMDNPTVWIAGGVDKGNDYTSLLELASEKVRALVCLGTDNEKMVEAFKERVPMVLETNSMVEAVEMAYKISEKNDNVLLAPACASFDLFENYMDRGDQFKKAVMSL